MSQNMFIFSMISRFDFNKTTMEFFQCIKS